MFDGPFGTVYSFYIERPRLSRLIARAVWASDIRPYYASFGAIAEVPDGGLVVDAPCGSGVALRGLSPECNVRYLAVDLSERMLERVRRRRLPQVECVRADVCRVPVDDGSTDLFLSLFGLHCFADPRAAVREIARVLKPDGRLVGSAIVPAGGRAGWLVKPGRGGFGRLASRDEIAAWLREAGFMDLELDRRGAFLYFTATVSGRS